ncbi:MAG: hypothetical protein KAR39_10510 [Thermoplasmata archaeon]|nr:hypothetical protein [Thermoplasmata archaeon]
MTGMTMVCLLFSVALTVTVVASPQLLKPETADGDEWSIYTIYPSGYPSGRIRGDISVALDSHDLPHISYCDEVLSDPHDADLKYARWVGSNWSIETVDSDGNVGLDNSIALDSHDYPHIAYFDDTNDDLKYAWWNGSVWNNETVDSAGHVGRYASVALDNQDHPHVSYQAQIQVGGVAHYDLRHAWWNGSAWNIETVDTYIRGYTSIALDSHDYPHISYHDDVNFNLKYARWNGSTWSIETVDPLRLVGSMSSLALDIQDFPHIGYYAGGANDDLRYARWNGSTWSIETVDSIGRVGQWPSLAIDSGDFPHISYSSADSGLKYARWNGTAWTLEIVDTIDAVGTSTSIAVDSKGHPHIACNTWSRNLKYATKAKLLKPYVSLNIDPDTLNLKSKGRWITAYLTTENANAEDIYPSSLLLNDVIPPAWWNIQNETTLMVKFDRAAVQAILPVPVSVDIKITGQWKDGEVFELHDIIRVIDVGGHKGSPWSIHSREGLLSHLGMEIGASSADLEAVERPNNSLSETDVSAVFVAPDGKERLSHYSSKVRSPESRLYTASSIAVPLI